MESIVLVLLVEHVISMVPANSEHVASSSVESDVRCDLLGITSLS